MKMFLYIKNILYDFKTASFLGFEEFEGIFQVDGYHVALLKLFFFCQKLPFHNWPCEKVFFICMKHALVGRKQSAEISGKIQLFYNGNKVTVHCNCPTTILLRGELWSPSYLVFWNFKKYLRKVFQTTLNDLFLASQWSRKQ